MGLIARKSGQDIDPVPEGVTTGVCVAVWDIGLGKCCLLQVMHKVSDGKVFANVVAVMTLPKSMPAAKAERGLQFYALDDGGEPPQDTSQWVLQQILSSDEYAGRHEDAGGAKADAMAPADEDKLPF